MVRKLVIPLVISSHGRGLILAGEHSSCPTVYVQKARRHRDSELIIEPERYRKGEEVSELGVSCFKGSDVSKTLRCFGGNCKVSV